MVKIKDIRVSNTAFKESEESLVALFVGATSGIGMGTLKQFAKHAFAPKVYILGRSKSAAAPLLKELTSSNPQATFVFLETEISLMSKVDDVCEKIKSNEKKLDILFMSPGYLYFGGRIESAEGIDVPYALRYYCRLRFAYNLLSLLNASKTPRVVAILGGGKEIAIDLNDLELRNNFSSIKAAGIGATQTTLAFEELAKSNPGITFIHKFPGFVSTGVIDKLLSTAKGLYVIPATFARWVIVPVIQFFATSIDVAGERGLFIATSARYPPAQPKTEMIGVDLPEGVEVAKSSIVTYGNGNGVYTLDENDESTPDAPVMPSYRQDGVGRIVWDKTQAVWDRALGRSG